MMTMEIILLALLAVLAIPVLVLLVQALVAVSTSRQPVTLIGRRPKIAVLVPAHNEAKGIAATVTLIRSQLMEEQGDCIVVVADNCSDATASSAVAAGAIVLERRDEVRRGKGYALDYGVRYLADSANGHAPDAVIFIDADCIVLPGSIDLLARMAIASQRPVQALDLMRAPRGSSLKLRIAEFAWVVKNRVRPLGFHLLGLPCQLMGTGMAFPWSLIAGAELATGHIAEDMKLGIGMAKAGVAPLFCPDACVISYFPVGDEAARAQRTRWEHGHLSMIVSEGWPLLRHGIARRDRTLIAMALDMCVPPVALLTLLVLGAFAVMLGVRIATGVHAPLAMAAAIFGALFAAVFLSWMRFGRSIVSFGDLLAALGYAFWKVPLYLKFLVSRQVEWVRAKRDAD
ncbi:MAG TPA: glycosyltransferase family 2 protein [Oxalicibacterium sp.]|uniref:glycosyltransferase family 2 protein n=1 Tax=Oxalicibacterium sp. TaxID=2766525 RepID=UPI002BAE5F5B|nr:glycosyltransferase family 2 protein [Oxalicibacterium sp.]HWU97500.1 glycosyltransferase family 2 protein [Oxalicibacterium sp.]